MIEYRVDYHPSGKRTLKWRKEGEQMFTDCQGDLFANNDQASFYRAVAKVLGDGGNKGETFTYRDTSPE